MFYIHTLIHLHSDNTQTFPNNIFAHKTKIKYNLVSLRVFQTSVYFHHRFFIPSSHINSDQSEPLFCIKQSHVWTLLQFFRVYSKPSLHWLRFTFSSPLYYSLFTYKQTSSLTYSHTSVVFSPFLIKWCDMVLFKLRAN